MRIPRVLHSPSVSFANRRALRLQHSLAVAAPRPVSKPSTWRSLQRTTSSLSQSSTSEPPPVAYAQASPPKLPKSPFRFDTGIALFAKRKPRPFPPPFLSPPSGSFSDALSTHDRASAGPRVNREPIRGHTNGDDAVLATPSFICANDGVGAWSTRPRGHAGLWSRLILHFWSGEIDATRVQAAADVVAGRRKNYIPDPVEHLHSALEKTIDATSAPNDWQGTTTASGAQLHFNWVTPDAEEQQQMQRLYGRVERIARPMLYVTQLGDSAVLVIRPSDGTLVFKTAEQWHWFDCPLQLGTNSPDTPRANAVLDMVSIQEGDVVLAVSDGVIDNLWTHEIVTQVTKSVADWEAGHGTVASSVPGNSDDGQTSMMAFVAKELMEAARVVAVDPTAESPFMEHAVEEGLAIEGGKLDDISVVAAICRRNDDK